MIVEVLSLIVLFVRNRLTARVVSFQGLGPDIQIGL
jgi:hypothetical protein